MSFIDGIGDEVTQFLIAVLVVVVVTVAWWSTNTTRDPRSLRGVYLVDYRVRMLRDYQRTYQSNRVTSLQFNRHNNRHSAVRVISNSRSTSTDNIQLEDPIATSSISSAIVEETSNAPINRLIPGTRQPSLSRESFPLEQPEESVDIETENNEAEAQAEQERATIIQVMDADETEVRRRRIAFFTGRRNEANPQDASATSDLAVASSSLQSERSDNIIATSTGPVERTESDNSDSGGEEESAIGDANIYEGDYDRELDSTIMEHNYAELPIIDNRTITIKLKYTNDEMKIVTGKLQEKLGDFKLRNFSEEYSNDRSVRLIFNGKILNEDERTIASCGIFHNCVVHCLVIQGRERPRGTPTGGIGLGEPVSGSRDAVFNDSVRQTQFVRTQQQNAADRNGRQRQHREWSLGTLLSRLTNFFLLCAWYLRYSVPHIWTMTATLCLVALTGFSLIAHVGIYMPNGQAAQNVNIRANRIDRDLNN